MATSIQMEKSMHIGLYQSHKFVQLELEYLLEKASMLRSIVDISLVICDSYISLLKTLLYYNKKNIERYFVHIDGIKTSNQLKPPPLIKAQNICVRTMYYYIVWSCRCKILELIIRRIDEHWIRFVIDNCDCSGVERLILNDISFSSLLHPDTKSTQLLVNKFAHKFNNLQSLKAIDYKLCLILLLKSPIIKQNSAMVALGVDSGFIDCDKLMEMSQDTEIKIYQLSIWIMDEKSIAIDTWKPIILNNAKLEYLKMFNWICYQDVVRTRILDLLLSFENESNTTRSKFKALNSDELARQETKSALSSLKMIDIECQDPDTSINTIDQILRLKLIKKHKVYIKLALRINATHTNVFQASFKTLCQTVTSLLTYHKNPIELNITIATNDLEISHFEQIYYPIFQQYLNQDVANNFKAPIVNKYCKPFRKPVISLTFEQNGDDDIDDESYVENSNSQMRFHVCNVTENLECKS